jgi:Uncharacterized protein conserved in bacteria
MKTVSYEQALTRLAAYCSRSERCVQDVRKKLDQWEISLQEQSQIIQTLQKEKFLDENRYASAFVRDKARFNGWGIYRIRLELKKRELPAEIITNAIHQLDSEETINRLADLLKKKSDSVKAKTEWEAKQKLIRFALSRGFSMDDVEKAMAMQ